MARAQITISMSIMLNWPWSGLLSSAGAIWCGVAGIHAAKLSQPLNCLLGMVPGLWKLLRHKEKWFERGLACPGWNHKFCCNTLNMYTRTRKRKNKKTNIKQKVCASAQEISRHSLIYRYRHSQIDLVLMLPNSIVPGSQTDPSCPWIPSSQDFGSKLSVDKGKVSSVLENSHQLGHCLEDALNKKCWTEKHLVLRTEIMFIHCCSCLCLIASS